MDAFVGWVFGAFLYYMTAMGVIWCWIWLIQNLPVLGWLVLVVVSVLALREAIRGILFMCGYDDYRFRKNLHGPKK